MEFKVLPVDSDVKKEKNSFIYLVEDNWNDWWKYRVLYQVYYKDEIEEVHYIGSVKIGEKDMGEQDKINLPDYFSSPLDRKFFSLGQDKYYYENLNRIGDQFRDEYLRYMNDIALDLDLLETVKDLDVTSVALLRDINARTVKKTFNNLARGNSSLSEYDFKFVFPHEIEESINYELTFESEPDSNPPTNVHALIGRNGVGKTYLLNKMVASLMMKNKDKMKRLGKLRNTSVFKRKEKVFDNIIYLSFSAFDDAKYFNSKKINRNGIGYSYIGLKQKVKTKQSTKTIVQTKSTQELRVELIEGIWFCKNIPSKKARLEQALDMLNNDPVFSMSGVSDLLTNDEIEANVHKKANNEKRFLTEKEKDLLKEHFLEKSLPICKKFSSGHSIVLLTITKLIQELEEKTLVLLDEPESHLHPPLLSTFTRILSNLLVSRNGIGIIATHSPVIIQEVPRKCVWIMNRYGRDMEFERPQIETFGENINILTKEVFSFEITHSGFHKLLNDVANKIDSYEEALDYFNNELGMEARVMLKALYKLRGNSNEKD